MGCIIHILRKITQLLLCFSFKALEHLDRINDLGRSSNPRFLRNSIRAYLSITPGSRIVEKRGFPYGPEFRLNGSCQRICVYPSPWSFFSSSFPRCSEMMLQMGCFDCEFGYTPSSRHFEDVMKWVRDLDKS